MLSVNFLSKKKSALSLLIGFLVFSEFIAELSLRVQQEETEEQPKAVNYSEMCISPGDPGEVCSCPRPQKTQRKLGS